MNIDYLDGMIINNNKIASSIIKIIKILFENYFSFIDFT